MVALILVMTIWEILCLYNYMPRVFSKTDVKKKLPEKLNFPSDTKLNQKSEEISSVQKEALNNVYKHSKAKM